MGWGAGEQSDSLAPQKPMDGDCPAGRSGVMTLDALGGWGRADGEERAVCGEQGPRKTGNPAQWVCVHHEALNRTLVGLKPWDRRPGRPLADGGHGGHSPPRAPLPLSGPAILGVTLGVQEVTPISASSLGCTGQGCGDRAACPSAPDVSHSASRPQGPRTLWHTARPPARVFPSGCT